MSLRQQQVEKRGKFQVSADVPIDAKNLMASRRVLIIVDQE